MARPRQVSDEQILDAARRVFLEQGPGISTSVIAAEVGVSAAALFKRFGTKEQLMLASLMPDPTSIFARVRELPDPDRPMLDQLIGLADDLGAFLRDLMPRVMCLHNANIDHHTLFAQHPEPPPLVMHRLVTRWMQHAIDNGQIRADASATTVAMMLVGSLQARGLMHHLTKVPVMRPDPDYAAEVATTLWRGLAPEVA